MATTAGSVSIGGIEVERRWPASRLIRRDGSASYVVMIVLTDEGAPTVESFAIKADPPLAAGEVRPIDLDKLARSELHRKLAQIAGYDLAVSGEISDMPPWERSPADVAAVDARVRDALGQQHKLGTRVDDAFLIKVLKRYQEAKAAGTPQPITAISEPYGVHERTARRWLSEARERGLS